jgi:hypothetical protein
MGQNGGARPGAGRPKGTISETERIRRELRQKLAEHVEKIFPKLVEASEALMLGHYVEVKMADGTKRVYKKPPNGMVIRDFLEQAMGKPTQAVEVEHGGEVGYRIVRGDPEKAEEGQEEQT